MKTVLTACGRPPLLPIVLPLTNIHRTTR